MARVGGAPVPILGRPLPASPESTEEVLPHRWKGCLPEALAFLSGTELMQTPAAMAGGAGQISLC